MQDRVFGRIFTKEGMVMKITVTGNFLACLVDKNNEFTREMANYEMSKAAVVFLTITAILEFANILVNQY